MVPHIFTHPDMPSQTFPSLDKPPVDFMRLNKRLYDHACPFILRSEETPPRSMGARLRPKTDGPDNTVGPVPKISGYVFNTLQTNSAAYVPNTNMNLVNEDTHICDLNLYETIFQNWCLIDSLSSMTPPPDANASSDASKLQLFTDRHLDFNEESG